MPTIKQARVLVVDDEASIRLVLRTTLESVGYDVAEAPDGAVALKRLATGKYDVIILDLNMPVLDGMSVLQRLTQMPDRPVAPVIVLTAHGSVPLAVRAVRLGAVDFLQKPVTPDDLRLSVAAALDDVANAAPAKSPTPSQINGSDLLQQVRRDIWQHDLAHAEKLLEQIATKAQDDPAYFNLLGVVHEAEGDRRAALTFYRKSAGREAGGYEPARQNLQRLHEIEFYGESKIQVQLGDEAEMLRGFGGNLGDKHLDQLRRILTP